MNEDGIAGAPDASTAPHPLSRPTPMNVIDSHRVLQFERPQEPAADAARPMLLNDPRSRALLAQLDRVARSDATVVIVGETGTGKELAARRIHATSGRRGPFVAVNCGAFSETLIDAELFGHEAGAFTGAQGARAGWFEAANGGTLFLDEIGELPLPMQVKLLRVLQERQVVRIGSRRPIPVDVRLVAATNVDLERAVGTQRFRADLYYRLNVAPLHLPPLRERPGDILPLARHFIRAITGRAARPEVPLSREAEEKLLAHAWPGNIRELENAIQTALILSQGRPIGAEALHLMPPLLLANAQEEDAVDEEDEEEEADEDDGEDAAPASAARPGSALPGGAVFDMDLGASPVYGELLSCFEHLIGESHASLFQSVEEALVRIAYARSRENQVHAARTLGITRNMLRTLLKRYGLLGSAEEADLPVSRTPLRFPAARRAASAE